MAFLPVAGLAAVALREGGGAARLIHRHRPRSPAAPGRAGLPARYVDTIPTQSMLQERQKGTRRPRRRATPGMVQTNRPPSLSYTLRQKPCRSVARYNASANLDKWLRANRDRLLLGFLAHVRKKGGSDYRTALEPNSTERKQ